MSAELNIILHNQLDVVLHRFLNQQNEPTENSHIAINTTLSSIIAALLVRINGNPNQALSLHEHIYGEKGRIFDHMLEQTHSDQISFDELKQIGADLLPLIFATQGLDVAQKIAQNSHISSLTAPHLLTITTPLVLSVLRKLSLDSHAWLTLLGSQQQWLSTALPANLQNTLNIGSISGLSASVASMVAHTDNIKVNHNETPDGFRAWWLLLVMFIIAILSLRTCSSSDATTPKTTQNNQATHSHANHHTQTASAADIQAATSMMNMSAQSLSAPTSTSASVVASTESAHFAASTPAEKSADATASTPNKVTKSTASEPIAASNPVAQNTKKARVVMENGVAKFYFASGFSKIAKGADQVVADVIEAGQAGKTLTISGFTDSTGNPKNNLQLSKKRAQAVRAFFIAHGVKAENIKLHKPENITGAQGKNQEGRRVDVQISD